MTALFIVIAMGTSNPTTNIKFVAVGIFSSRLAIAAKNGMAVLENSPPRD
jgi:hypothetical protein